MMAKLTAQNLYDLREATGFVSGNDLHDAFEELVGEPSPSGKVAVEVPDDHWLAQAAKFGSYRELADAVEDYSPDYEMPRLAGIARWATTK